MNPRWSKPIRPLAPLSPHRYPRSRSTPPRCPPGSSRPAMSASIPPGMEEQGSDDPQEVNRRQCCERAQQHNIRLIRKQLPEQGNQTGTLASGHTTCWYFGKALNMVRLVATGNTVLVKLFNDINKRKGSVQHADLQNSLFEEIVSRRFLFVLLLKLPSRPLVEIFQLLVILVVQEFRHVAQDRVDGLCLGEPLGALLHVLSGHPSLAQVDVPWDKHTPRLHQPRDELPTLCREPRGSSAY
uniref:(California timema) hypothetical protein n=1 Tax=Timema californicum TaxID=61474 RepID=A0A7R9P9Q1_TIMCA|nr:unnamed protein product [Timema californicum]